MWDSGQVAVTRAEQQVAAVAQSLWRLTATGLAPVSPAWPVHIVTNHQPVHWTLRYLQHYTRPAPTRPRIIAANITRHQAPGHSRLLEDLYATGPPLISDLTEATMIHIILHCRDFWLPLSISCHMIFISPIWERFISIWKELWLKSQIHTCLKNCFVYHLLIYNKNCKVLIWNQIIKMYDSSIPNILDPLTSL